MSNSVNVSILRVFVDENGEYGNPVGVVIDEEQNLNPTERQTIASKLNFSETVFINDLNAGNLSIYNPKKEVKFAGHALAGTAFYINNILGKSLNSLDCKGGHIETWQEDNLTWIHAYLVGTPPWQFKQLGDAASVEKLSFTETKVMEHTVIWAWIDQEKGIIRARTFAPDWGIPEDEANGSGSMQLAYKLNKRLEIRHGKGSVIYTKPSGEGSSDVGGRIKEDPSKEMSF